LLLTYSAELVRAPLSSGASSFWGPIIVGYNSGLIPGILDGCAGLLADRFHLRSKRRDAIYRGHLTDIGSRAEQESPEMIDILLSSKES
jgi:hypothetical protein